MFQNPSIFTLRSMPVVDEASCKGEPDKTVMPKIVVVALFCSMIFTTAAVVETDFITTIGIDPIDAVLFWAVIVADFIAVNAAEDMSIENPFPVVGVIVSAHILT